MRECCMMCVHGPARAVQLHHMQRGKIAACTHRHGRRPQADEPSVANCIAYFAF